MDKPQWAKAIEVVRKKCGLTQAGFAQRLGTTQSNVSKWESGVYEPSPDIYLQLAGMADPADSDFFYVRAKLSPEQIDRFKNQPVLDLADETDRVEVALLRHPAAAGTPRDVLEKEIEQVFAFSKSMVPRPATTRLIRVKGDSMSPVLEDGDLVAVDTSLRNTRTLVNEMVAARDPEGGVTLKWLRKVDGDWMLIPQHTSKRHQPVLLREGWEIVGRVLFSIRQFK